MNKKAYLGQSVRVAVRESLKGASGLPKERRKVEEVLEGSKTAKRSKVKGREDIAQMRKELRVSKESFEIASLMVKIGEGESEEDEEMSLFRNFADRHSSELTRLQKKLKEYVDETNAIIEKATAEKRVLENELVKTIKENKRLKEMLEAEHREKEDKLKEKLGKLREGERVLQAERVKQEGEKIVLRAEHRRVKGELDEANRKLRIAESNFLALREAVAKGTVRIGYSGDSAFYEEKLAEYCKRVRELEERNNQLRERNSTLSDKAASTPANFAKWEEARKRGNFFDLIKP